MSVAISGTRTSQNAEKRKANEEVPATSDFAFQFSDFCVIRASSDFCLLFGSQ